MNWVDWLILGILAYNGLTGFFKGLIRSLASLAALILATMAAGQFGALGARLVGLNPKGDLFTPLIGSAVVWVIVFLVLSVAGTLLSWLIRTTRFKGGDRWTGLLFGLLFGLVTVLMPLAFVDKVPLLQGVQAVDATRRSSLLWRALRPLEPPALLLTRLCFGWNWEQLMAPPPTKPKPPQGKTPARKPVPPKR